MNGQDLYMHLLNYTLMDLLPSRYEIYIQILAKDTTIIIIKVMTLVLFCLVLRHAIFSSFSRKKVCRLFLFRKCSRIFLSTLKPFLILVTLHPLQILYDIFVAYNQWKFYSFCNRQKLNFIIQNRFLYKYISLLYS